MVASALLCSYMALKVGQLRELPWQKNSCQVPKACLQCLHCGIPSSECSMLECLRASLTSAALSSRCCRS